MKIDTRLMGLVNSRRERAAYAGLTAIALLTPCAVWSIRVQMTHNVVDLLNGGGLVVPVWYWPLFTAGVAVALYGMILKYSHLPTEFDD